VFIDNIAYILRGALLVLKKVISVLYPVWLDIAGQAELETQVYYLFKAQFS